MNYLFVLLIIGLALMVVVSLIRGLIAFVRMSDDMTEDGITKSHAMQNKMMFARVKYQALAVVAIAILLLMNR